MCMDFCQFLNESWTDVPSWFLAIYDVPFMIRNEPYEAKNKIVKPHVGETYLTLSIIPIYGGIRTHL